MRLLNLCVPLGILALASMAACDGDNTPGGAPGNGDVASDANSAAATQAAPNTATQAAPNTATQAAANTATQAAPNTATQQPASSGESGSDSGTGTGLQCATVCNHIVAMECTTSAACEARCPALEAPGNCQSLAQTLARCAMAASSCDALDACDPQSDALDACVDGDTSGPITTPTTTFTIKDPANCNTATLCQNCSATALCDVCVCAGQLESATPAVISTACASFCASS